MQAHAGDDRTGSRRNAQKIVVDEGMANISSSFPRTREAIFATQM